VNLGQIWTKAHGFGDRRHRIEARRAPVAAEAVWPAKRDKEERGAEAVQPDPGATWPDRGEARKSLVACNKKGHGERANPTGRRRFRQIRGDEGWRRLGGQRREAGAAQTGAERAGTERSGAARRRWAPAATRAGGGRGRQRRSELQEEGEN
jgi:hypothetical protein